MKNFEITARFLTVLKKNSYFQKSTYTFSGKYYYVTIKIYISLLVEMNLLNNT